MNYTENTKVTGTYYGKKITGTIIENRMNYRSYKSHIRVELESPIALFGEVRNRVIFDSVDENTGLDLCGSENEIYPVKS